MKFLDNIYDPNRSDTKWHIHCAWDETQEEAWERRQKWLADKVIGEPQAEGTPHTVAELKAFGMVGVYTVDT